MPIPLVSFHEAEKRYAGQIILREMNLTINRDEAVAVLGNNGTGKSTLLKLIGGFSLLSSGVRKHHRPDLLSPKIGYVPDRFAKVRFSGYEYLEHMGSIRGMSKNLLELRIEELLLQFGLDSEASKRPIRQYSKGMIQKINVMQAILEPPELLLLDEPLSGLDIRTQEELCRILFSLKAQGIAIVWTSHEKGLTEKLADRVILLENGLITEKHNRPVEVMMYKAIECVLPENEVMEDWAKLEGVLECRETEGRYWFRVGSEHSDNLLKLVLHSNGHIFSVIHEEDIQLSRMRKRSDE
jgi:ABC-2 type transport system ATP-binding protein